jgi:hypothetical protein
MPIPSEKLNTDFIVATADETIGMLRPRLSSDRVARLWTYVVLPAADGLYLVVRWIEVEQIAAATGGNLWEVRLDSLPGLPQPVEAVKQASMGLRSAQSLQQTQPGERLVVLANGTVIGLLAPDDRDAANMGRDPFAPREVSFDIDAGGVEPDPETPVVPAVVERVINAWVIDPDNEQSLANDQPLRLGHTYDLRFNVAAPRGDAIASSAPLDTEALFADQPAGEEFVEIQVMIETDDFRVYGYDQQLLIVPRAGRSKNSVTFAIEPKREGPGVVKAMFIANKRVIQKLTITFQVGVLATPVAPDTRTLGPDSVAPTPTISMQTSGLTMSSAMALPARQNEQVVNLMIVKKEAGYQFILQAGGVTRALLNLSETQIAELIARARADLRAIVYTLADRQYIYQVADTAIPAAVHTATLKTLARLGYYLYQKLFYAPGNGPDARAMGDLLRQLSQQHQLHVEIIAERFIFPWALLYDRHPLDLNQVAADGLWGFKHVIEYMPEFSSATPVNFVPQMKVSDTLGLGFIYNTTIDAQLKTPVVQQQRDFLKGLPGVSVAEYATVREFYNLLNNPDAPVQLLYLYCHAVSNLPGEKDGVAGSKVLLSDGAAPLADLDVEAPIDGRCFKLAPLVFLNACQSAELSPYLYEGLVPYLIAKGARGVLGTEVDTPALFAAEFAQDFLKRFVAGGQPLGDLLLAMRREYLDGKNNVMGLVYALYSSGDVVVQRTS